MYTSLDTFDPTLISHVYSLYGSEANLQYTYLTLGRYIEISPKRRSSSDLVLEGTMEHEMGCTTVTKRELSLKAKLSIYRSIFVLRPMLMTERTRSRIQAANWVSSRWWLASLSGMRSAVFWEGTRSRAAAPCERKEMPVEVFQHQVRFATWLPR